MKLNQVVTKTIDAATAAGLDAAISAFLATVGEATLISMHFSTVVGGFAVLIAYTN